MGKVAVKAPVVRLTLERDLSWVREPVKLVTEGEATWGVIEEVLPLNTSHSFFQGTVH